MRLSTITAAVTAVVGSGSAHADIINTFSFDSTALPGAVAAGAAVSPFAAEGGASGFVQDGHWNASNWDTSDFLFGRHTGFTITADVGATVTIEQIDLAWWFDGASSSGASIRMIVTGPDGDQIFNFPSPGGIPNGGYFSPIDYNIADITLDAGESATFRWQLEGRSGSTLNLDSITVSGTIVPAPGSITLGAVAGLLIARRRR
jgi:hypothetical protein